MSPGDPTSPPGEVPPWLIRAVQDVIVLAMDGNGQEVCDRLELIGNQGGHMAMFSACVAWATATGTLSGMADAMEQADPGVACIPMPLGEAPVDETSPGTFAARFFACVMNKQIGTAHALFDATMHDVEHHQQCVIEVVLMVAGAARMKWAEVEAERRAAAGAANRHHARPRGAPPQRSRNQ